MTSALRGGGTGRNLTNGRGGSVDLVLIGNFLPTPFVWSLKQTMHETGWMKGLGWRNKSRGKICRLKELFLIVNKFRHLQPVSDEPYIQQVEQPFDKISETRGRIARNKYLWPGSGTCTWQYRRLPCWWNGVRPNLCLRPGLSRASSNGTATLRTTNVSRESWNQPTRASERERHPHTSHPVIKNRFYSKRVSSKVQSLSDEIHQGNSET